MNDRILEIAQLGAKAVADGDVGRSRYLMSEVGDAMKDLSADECDWLTLAVTDGAMQRQFREAEADPLVANVTATGEVWNI